MKLRVLRRLVVPVLLVLGGIVSVIYGDRYHSAEVFETREVKQTIRIPTAFGPADSISGNSPWGVGGAPGQSPAPDEPGADGGPAFLTQTITRTLQVPKTLLEPTLNRELTVGGVARLGESDAQSLGLEAGDLRQTYTGEAPSLCPT